jgi:FHS family L-fucose permease-like MFS transporter
MRLRTAPFFLTFFVMGVADAMGPLSDAVGRDYQLSNVVATLLPFFVFIAFAVFSVPGGALAARIGKRSLLLLGLAVSFAGVLVPALIAPSFAVLLGSIFALGVGTTFLQVSGNPIMRDVSDEGSYARNLTFAQFVKGAGSASSSYLVGLSALLPGLTALGWRGPFPIFAALMAIAFLAVLAVRVEEVRAESPPGLSGSLALLKSPGVSLAVLGIFLYVGAEVCLARFLKPTLEATGFSEDRAALLGPTLFFACLTIGRLLGGFTLTILAPGRFFLLSAILGLLGSLAPMFHAPLLGAVLCGLGFANIWPLLFSITVERTPERAAELSGLMCMAIAGGAIVPLVMGRLVDGGFGGAAYLVPAGCFVYLLALAVRK